MELPDEVSLHGVLSRCTSASEMMSFALTSQDQLRKCTTPGKKLWRWALTLDLMRFNEGYHETGGKAAEMLRSVDFCRIKEFGIIGLPCQLAGNLRHVVTQLCKDGVRLTNFGVFEQPREEEGEEDEDREDAEDAQKAFFVTLVKVCHALIRCDELEIIYLDLETAPGEAIAQSIAVELEATWASRIYTTSAAIIANLHQPAWTLATDGFMVRKRGEKKLKFDYPGKNETLAVLRDTSAVIEEYKTRMRTPDEANTLQRRLEENSPVVEQMQHFIALLVSDMARMGASRGSGESAELKELDQEIAEVLRGHPDATHALAALRNEYSCYF